MAQSNLFDAFRYFKKLGDSNRLAQEEGFSTGFCSGIGSLQDYMQHFRTKDRYILIDDTTTESTYSNGVGFFRKDVYTIFIVAGYVIDDMQDREAKLNLCRRIFRQIHSRLVHDVAEGTEGDALEYLAVDRIYSNELSGTFMNGVTGLYFMVENDEPIDLTYNANEWID